MVPQTQRWRANHRAAVSGSTPHHTHPSTPPQSIPAARTSHTPAAAMGRPYLGLRESVGSGHPLLGCCWRRDLDLLAACPLAPQRVREVPRPLDRGGRNLPSFWTVRYEYPAGLPSTLLYHARQRPDEAGCGHPKYPDGTWRDRVRSSSVGTAKVRSTQYPAQDSWVQRHRRQLPCPSRPAHAFLPDTATENIKPSTAPASVPLSQPFTFHSSSILYPLVFLFSRSIDLPA